MPRNTDYYQSVPHGGQDAHEPGLDPYGPGPNAAYLRCHGIINDIKRTWSLSGIAC
jgi:hypothetical protein